MLVVQWIRGDFLPWPHAKYDTLSYLTQEQARPFVPMQTHRPENPFSIPGQHQHQQQQAPPSLLLANGGMGPQKLEQQQSFGFPGAATTASAAAGRRIGGGVSVGCCSSCGGGGGGQGFVGGSGGGGRRGPDGSWLDEEGRRLYTEVEVRGERGFSAYLHSWGGGRVLMTTRSMHDHDEVHIDHRARFLT